jgi:hypothetical protein
MSLPDAQTMESLVVRGKGVTEHGLSKLNCMPKLTDLYISEIGVSPKNVVSVIGQLKQIEHLCIRGMPMTDREFCDLGGLVGLSSLDISGAGITDASLPHIGKMRRLTDLDLTATGVTDHGIEHLARLRRLRWLRIIETNVTREGVETLRRSALPGLTIMWVGGHPSTREKRGREEVEGETP